MAHGTLFLIPTFLSEDNTLTLPSSTLTILHRLDEFIVENEKSARRFLKLAGSPIAQPAFTFHLLNEHTKDAELKILIQPLLNGKNIGLMSEAGCPGVADPGSELVNLAHKHGITVNPLVGPSSILLALMGSGLNGQEFCFHGYLPRESAGRKQKLRELEKEILKKNQTQIFIETPYRNDALLQDILLTASSEINLCIACELTGKNQFIQTRKIKEWKNNLPKIQKLPCIFLLGK